MRVDGFFSGSLRSLPVSSAVKLLDEDLRFVFAGFEGSLLPDRAMVGITVRYEIANVLAGEVDVPALLI